MALIKEAILKLRLEGFDEANVKAQQLGRSLGRVSGDLKVVNKDAKDSGGNLSRSASDANRSWRGLAATIQATIVILGGVAAASAGALRLAQSGDNIKRVSDSFTTLSGGASAASVSLDRLKEATFGTLTATEIMTGKNRAMLGGVALSEEEFAKATTSVIGLSRALGVDATAAYQRFTDGLAKNEPELLDELGLTTKINEAYQQAADNLGVKVSQLDKATKQQAFANAVNEEAIAKEKLLGSAFQKNASAAELVRVQIAGMVEEIQTYVAENPQIVQAVGELAKAFFTLLEAVAPVAKAISDVIGLLGSGGLLGGGLAAAGTAVAVGLGAPIAAPVALGATAIGAATGALLDEDSGVGRAARGGSLTRRDIDAAAVGAAKARGEVGFQIGLGVR